MLEDKYPTVPSPSAEAARSLIVALAELGVVARFVQGPSYNPQERLACALAQVQSLLQPDILHNCQSLSAHGEWELALSHCLANLSQQADATAVGALSQLSIEFGVVQEEGQQ